MPQILPLEKKGEEQREGERATGEKGAAVWAPAKEGERGESG